MIASQRVVYQTTIQLIFTLPWAIAFGLSLKHASSEEQICSQKLRGWDQFAFGVCALHSAWAIVTSILFYFGYKTYYQKTEKPSYLNLMHFLQYMLAIASVISFFGIFFTLIGDAVCEPLQGVSRLYVIVNFVLFLFAFISFALATMYFQNYVKYFDWSIEERERLVKRPSSENEIKVV